MAGPILVEVECIRATAADFDYYEEGRKYTIDMVWAKKRDIWRYFRPIREVSNNEVQDRIYDEILPKQEEEVKTRDAINEEAEAKLKEQKSKPVTSYPPRNQRSKAKSKARN